MSTSRCPQSSSTNLYCNRRLHSKVVSAFAVIHAVGCSSVWAFGAALWRMVILSWLQTDALYFQTFDSQESLQYLLSGTARKNAEVENELCWMRLMPLQFSLAPGRTSGEVSELQCIELQLRGKIQACYRLKIIHEAAIEYLLWAKFTAGDYKH